MPRYLPIPKDIEFINIITKQPVLVEQEDGSKAPQKLSFREFFLNTLSSDPRFTTTKGARSLWKFEQAYDSAVAKDGVMILDEEVWKEFKDAAENPKHQIQAPFGGAQTVDGFAGYKGIGVMQLLPFIDAIANAADKEPSKVQDVDKAAAAG